MGHIWNTLISAHDENGIITAPPERFLELLVINGVATLRGRPGGESGRSDSDEPLFSIDVPAISLLHALKAAMREDKDTYGRA